MQTSLASTLNEYFSLKVFYVTFTALVSAAVLVGGFLVIIGSGEKGEDALHLSSLEISVPLQKDQAKEIAIATTAEAVPEEHPAAPQEEITPSELSPADTAPTPPPEEQNAAHETHPVEDALAGLHETTPFGMVPIVRKEDGMTAFKAYAAPFTLASNTKALVALVMVDYGLSEKSSKEAIEKLPLGVTLSSSPYAREAQTWITKARERGLEVWMGLPTQGKSFLENDTGPQTILPHGALEQNRDRLLTTLGKATGYAGVIDLDIPDFTGAEPELETVYRTIAERGLGLAQASPQDTTTGSFAVDLNAPFIQSDAWIDSLPTEESTLKELEKLEQRALNGRVSVGFFHPHPSVIKAIASWQKTAQDRGLQLAPLTASIEEKN
jgi:polysaccharide deacetylase 2 family uncharacterized protein YibQ